MANTAVVPLPPSPKRVKTGLVVLAFFLPPLAMYLDGGSGGDILLSLAICVIFGLLGFLACIVWTIIFVLRSPKERNLSTPYRRRLRVQQVCSLLQVQGAV